MPPTRRPWLRLFLAAGAVLLIGWLGLEAYDFVAGLFERSPLLGVGFAVVLALFVLGALGALGPRARRSAPARAGRASCA